MKYILKKLNKTGKRYVGLLALLPILITLDSLCLKFSLKLFMSGINYYNSMPLSLNIPFAPDVFTQIFAFLGVAIICIFSNSYCYYTVKNGDIKKFVKWLIVLLIPSLLIEFLVYIFTIDIPAKQFVPIFFKKYLRTYLLTHLVLFIMLVFFGIFLGFSYKDNTILSKPNERIAFRLFNKIPKPILNIITIVVFASLFFSPLFLGKAFAEDNKTFYVVEDGNLVIMAEQDGAYFCHPFIEKNKIIYIDTSEDSRGFKVSYDVLDKIAENVKTVALRRM